MVDLFYFLGLKFPKLLQFRTSSALVVNQVRFMMRRENLGCFAEEVNYQFVYSYYSFSWLAKMETVKIRDWPSVTYLNVKFYIQHTANISITETLSLQKTLWFRWTLVEG